MLQSPNKFITLRQAAALAPGNPSYLAVWRWARWGCKVTGSNERIHLRHQRFGSKILTTWKWLDEFGEAVALADREHFKTNGRSPRRARRQRVRLTMPDVERANYTLQEAGIID